MPHIAKQASSVTIFQRTPPGSLPRRTTSSLLKTASIGCCSTYPSMQSGSILPILVHKRGLLGSVRREPGYENQDDAVGEANDQLPGHLTGPVHGNARGLIIETVTPPIPRPASWWIMALGIKPSSCPTSKCSRIALRASRKGSLETESGTSHDFDVVIYATGFHASKIVWPMAIYGHTGKTFRIYGMGTPGPTSESPCPISLTSSVKPRPNPHQHCGERLHRLFLRMRRFATSLDAWRCPWSKGRALR